MAPSRAVLRQASRSLSVLSTSACPSTASRRLGRFTAVANASLTFRTPSAARPPVARRFYSESSSSSSSSSGPEPPDYLDERELHIFNLIKSELKPSKLEVQDVSGGCGSMYALDIVSEKFKGLPVIKQHRLVNSVLGEEIKKWHGVQLKTRAP